MFETEPEPEPVPEPVAEVVPEPMPEETAVVEEVPATETEVSAEAEVVEGEVAADEVQASDEDSATADGEIEIREGESLADIKERIRKEQQKAKKPAIPPELLNSANSYEDKVGVVRMVVQADQSRVASAIRGMIQVK